MTDGGWVLILTPPPGPFVLCCVSLCCPLLPILSHFSLPSFVTWDTDLYRLIMEALLLVASHLVWPMGGTCGGKRGDGAFLRCSFPVSVWVSLELQLSSCHSSSSCPFLTEVGEEIKAPCCLWIPCCSPYQALTHINSPISVEFCFPAGTLHL